MFNFATVLWHCLSAFLKSASLNIPGRSAPKTNIILQEIKCTFNCMVITSYHCYYCYYFFNSRFSVCSIKILKLKKYFWRNGLFKILRLFNEAKKPSYGSISCDHFSNRKTYYENIPTLSSDLIPVTSKTFLKNLIRIKNDQNLLQVERKIGAGWFSPSFCLTQCSPRAHSSKVPSTKCVKCIFQNQILVKVAWVLAGKPCSPSCLPLTESQPKCVAR